MVSNWILNFWLLLIFFGQKTPPEWKQGYCVDTVLLVWPKELSNFYAMVNGVLHRFWSTVIADTVIVNY